MILGRIVMGLLALVVGAALSRAVADAVVGGEQISVRSAPWAVFIRDSFGPDESYVCSGTIIDATHVLTAAHCLFNVSGVFTRPSQLEVEAGISNYRQPRATDARQARAVRSMRVEPGYVWRDPPTLSDTAHDLAVLTLSEPLDLRGPQIQAATLAPARAATPFGAIVVLAGFGRTTAGIRGPLVRLRSRIFVRSNCQLLAGILCSTSDAGGTCGGDSGAGLVTTSPQPRLVAVLSGGSARCGKNELDLSVDLGAPSARRFIYGHSGTGTPPQAPAERWVPSGWKTIENHPPGGKRGRLIISVPRAWSTTTNSPLLVALNRQTGTGVRLGFTPGTWSSPRYFPYSLKNALALYRRTDPAAVVHSRELNLPGTRILEVSVRLMAPQGGRRVPTSVREYFVAHDGVGYDIQCIWPASHDKINIPTFEQFVRTIHFVG